MILHNIDLLYQLSNVLNGTCQVGQLLLRGYAQELENGDKPDREDCTVGEEVTFKKLIYII